jgi:hypothetical protein
LVVRGMLCATALILASAALPVRAQRGVAPEPVDLSGSWVAPLTQDVLERGTGPVLGDWTGMPLNAGGKALAQSYDAAMLAEPERVCQFYNQWHYIDGAFQLRIWPLVTGPTAGIHAWRLESTEDIGGMTIWMDGRPAPGKYARHPLGAFTTGHWVGDMLIAYTTDMKPSEMRRNGAMMSDEATLTSTFIPHGGNMLTVVFVLEDPIYLTQPYMYVRTYMKSARPVSTNWGPCIITNEGTPEGVVPFYLPGRNPIIGQMMKFYHIPAYASEGGAATMYPQFRDRMKTQFLKLYPTFPKTCTDVTYCTLGPAPRRPTPPAARATR